MFQWKTLKDANEEYSTRNFLIMHLWKDAPFFLSFYFNFFYIWVSKHFTMNFFGSKSKEEGPQR